MFCFLNNEEVTDLARFASNLTIIVVLRNSYSGIIVRMNLEMYIFVQIQENLRCLLTIILVMFHDQLIHTTPSIRQTLGC